MKQPTSQQTVAGWAVVTGGSSGLGREFVLALSERGYPVLAVARRGERLHALADEVGASGGRLEPLVADLSTTEGVEALLWRAASLEIELLVNNAGVATYGSFASTPVERERELLRLNVEAIVTLTGRLLPSMLARGHGGVINVASQMAFQPMPYFAAYAASKAFVLSFSEAIAEELRGTAFESPPSHRISWVTQTDWSDRPSVMLTGVTRPFHAPHALLTPSAGGTTHGPRPRGLNPTPSIHDTILSS